MRALLTTNIIPGHLNVSMEIASFAINGSYINTTAADILIVKPGFYKSEWQPHIAGTRVPQNVVIGGHKSGAPLYVARSIVVDNQLWAGGYYDNQTGIASAPFDSSHKLSSHYELLVIVEGGIY